MNALNQNDLRTRYTTFYEKEPTAEDSIRVIESDLEISLPNDVKEIATFYPGGFLGGKSHFAFDTTGPEDNVVNETLRLRRAIDMPQRFVALAEPPSSLIVLDCDSGEVIWCDATDATRLNDISSMITTPDIWPNYSAFFEYLLDEEERDRNDNSPPH